MQRTVCSVSCATPYERSYCTATVNSNRPGMAAAWFGSFKSKLGNSTPAASRNGRDPHDVLCSGPRCGQPGVVRRYTRARSPPESWPVLAGPRSLGEIPTQNLAAHDMGEVPGRPDSLAPLPDMTASQGFRGRRPGQQPILLTITGLGERMFFRRASGDQPICPGIPRPRAA